MKGRLACWLLALALAGALGHRLHTGWTGLCAGEVELRVARTVIAAGGRIEYSQADVFAAELKEADWQYPVDVSIPIARGSLYLITGRPERAVAAYERALAVEPRSEIYRNLGHAYLAMGDLRKARRVLRTAIELDHMLAPLLRPELRRINAELERRKEEKNKKPPA